MKRYYGTEKGSKGVYLNLHTGEFIQINEKVGVFPGDSETRYVRVPSFLAMIVGPFAGLAFVIFLPFAGVIGVLGFLGYKLGQGFRAFGRSTAQLVTVGWQPGRAYFTREGSAAGRKPSDRDEKELKQL